MKKEKALKYFIALSILFISVVYSVQYWIARFTVKAELQKSDIASILLDIEEQNLLCDNCSLVEINSSYMNIGRISGKKLLFIGIWSIESRNQSNIKISVWKSKRSFNVTQSTIGVGYFDYSCNNSFYNVTGINVMYKNKYLCVLDYSSGSYSEYVLNNFQGSKNITVFLWIPVVMENTNLSMGSYVYLLE